MESFPAIQSQLARQHARDTWNDLDKVLEDESNYEPETAALRTLEAFCP